MLRTSAAVLAVLAAAVPAPALAQAPAGAPPLSLFPSPWGQGGASANGGDGDGWDAAYVRARAFVADLTLVEKVNLTTGTGWEFDRCIGNTGAIPRLGFRSLCLEDGTVAVRYTDNNSVFPAGVNAAATFSRDLMYRRGLAMGAEFRGKGIDVALGPVAGPLGRVPAGGRNWEGFSPDPYLTGVGMFETVRGMQAAGVIATAKHYILNEQEHFRNNVDVGIDDRTMHELYLWPFADAVRAGVGAVMCSYNKINGKYSCENSWTLNYLLKNELGFQGFVMSDWGAQHSTLDTALAGLDMAMPGDGGPRGSPYGAFWGGALTEAVLNGTVPQWRLDDMAVRIMAAFYKVAGDRPRPDINFSAWVAPNISVGPVYYRANASIEEVNLHVNVRYAHGAITRELAAKSLVLLKNNQTFPGAGLPMNPDGLFRTIALIGDDAQDPPGGPNACPDNKCYGGTLATGYGSGPGNFPYLSSPAAALRRRAIIDNHLMPEAPNNWDVESAVAAARDADAAIVFANADSGEGYITIDGNTGDRNNLTLWGNGDALIRAVAAVCNNTVVVLHTVGPVLIDYAAEHPNVTAIVWAGLPGQDSGLALVDVLYGDVLPQGRSPFTWARKAADYGAEVMYTSPTPMAPSQNFSEGIFIDYRYTQRAGTPVVYPFGHGLTYTEFDFANLTVEAAKPGTLSGTVPLSSGNGTAANATGHNQTPRANTDPAPTLGTVDTSRAANEAPAGFQRIKPFIYPWLVPNATILHPANLSSAASPAWDPRRNASAQPVLPAGGAPGGHPRLFDTVYTVSFDIVNTGSRSGIAIPQLYVHLGGPTDPLKVLRGFDDVYVASRGGGGRDGTFSDDDGNDRIRVSMALTRRDVSTWDTAAQDWVVTNYTKHVFVGRSAEDIVLSATLPPLKA